MEYSIKQVAEKTRLKPHVLRYYEQEGLLPSVSRTESGIRRYSQEDLDSLGLICCLKNTGMSIKQIKAFVSLKMQGDCTLQERRDLLIAHKHQVEAQMVEMQRHLEKVAHKIAHYDSCLDKAQGAK